MYFPNSTSSAFSAVSARKPRLMRNKGAPGVDGMTVEELAAHLRAEWPAIRGRLPAGTYRPAPVRRHELPKPGGGTRVLGIPTVLDRFIQQAVLQVLQPEWDPAFSDGSFGFRPGRSAHQAVARAQEHYREGLRWVVDMDLEKFFDRVSHDKLMGLVSARVADWRMTRLTRRYLCAGMACGDIYCIRIRDGTAPVRDPYAGWCGRGAAARPLPIPIRQEGM